MEIRLKTAEEFRDAHVTIEIRVDGQAELEAVHDRLYDRYTIGDREDLLRQVRELTGDLADAKKALTLTTTSRDFNYREVSELKDKIRRMSDQMAGQSGRIEGLQDRAADLEAERDRTVEALIKVRAERDRLQEQLEEARKWSAATTKALGESRDLVEFKTNILDGVQAERDRLANQLKRISEIVNHSDVSEGLNWTPTKISTDLATAVRAIRTVLSSSSPSSQA